MIRLRRHEPQEIEFAVRLDAQKAIGQCQPNFIELVGRPDQRSRLEVHEELVKAHHGRPVLLLNFEVRQLDRTGEGIESNAAEEHGVPERLGNGRNHVTRDGKGHTDETQQRIQGQQAAGQTQPQSVSGKKGH